MSFPTAGTVENSLSSHQWLFLYISYTYITMSLNVYIRIPPLLQYNHRTSHFCQRILCTVHHIYKVQFFSSGFILIFKFLFSPIAAVFFELSKTLFYWKRHAVSRDFDRFFLLVKHPTLALEESSIRVLRNFSISRRFSRNSSVLDIVDFANSSVVYADTVTA